MKASKPKSRRHFKTQRTRKPSARVTSHSVSSAGGVGGGSGGQLPLISGTPRRRARTGEPKFPMLVPFADRLEQIRHTRRLTQQAAAQRAGISTNHYQALARAHANPTAIVLLRLAATLDVSIADLFDVRAPIPPAPFNDADRAALQQLFRHVESADFYVQGLARRRALSGLSRFIVGAVS